MVPLISFVSKAPAEARWQCVLVLLAGGGGCAILLQPIVQPPPTQLPAPTASKRHIMSPNSVLYAEGAPGSSFYIHP